MRRASVALLTGVSLVLASSTLARAADLDPLIPNESKVVVSFNMTQVLASPLGKKYLGGAIAQGLKDNAQAQALLKQIRFDPMKDVTGLTLAMTSGSADQSLVILTGKFNVAEIEKLAATAASENKDKFKIHEIESKKLYEMLDENSKATYAGFPSGSRLLLSSSKEMIRQALTAPGANFGKPSDHLQQLIKSADGKHSGWLAALPEVANELPTNDPQQKEALQKLDGIVGVLKLTENSRCDLMLKTKTANAALVLAKTVIDLVNLAKLFTPNVVKEKPELAPLLDIINAIRASARKDGVSITVELTGSQIEKAIQQLPK